MNLVRAILAHARTRPDTPALTQGDRQLTYRALADEVQRTSGSLRSRGVRQGDHVGICLKDTIDHIVTLLATASIGAVVVQIDWRARPTEKARSRSAFELKLVLVEPDEQPLAGAPSVAIDAEWHDAVRRSAPPADLPDDWNLPLLITSSSGTTGAPKYGMQTHLQYYFCLAATFELLPLPQRARYLSILPLYFANGRKKCLAHLLHGDSVMLHPPLVSAQDFVDLVARHEINVGHVLPATLRQLLQLAEDGRHLLPTIDLLVSAGAPLLADEKRAVLRNVSPNFYEEYGTAMTAIISVIGPQDMVERPDSVGQPHSLVELQIVDEAGAPVPSGTVGRLRARGPGVASGISAGGGTEGAEGFEDGWYYTGEYASMDDRAFVFLKGRSTEIIFRAGAKVYPAEVEAVLQQHPAVVEAAVVGRRIASGDEDVVAFVVVRRLVEPGELIAHCRTHLTAYKAPRDVRFVAEMPKNPIGKIDKRALVAQLDRR